MNNPFKRWTLLHIDEDNHYDTYLVQSQEDLDALLAAVMVHETESWVKAKFLDPHGITRDEIAEIQDRLRKGDIAGAWEQFACTSHELRGGNPADVSVFYLNEHTEYATASDYLYRCGDPAQQVLAPLSVTETLERTRKQLLQGVDELAAEFCAKLERKDYDWKHGDCRLVVILRHMLQVQQEVNAVGVEDLKQEAVS